MPPPATWWKLYWTIHTRQSWPFRVATRKSVFSTSNIFRVRSFFYNQNLLENVAYGISGMWQTKILVIDFHIFNSVWSVFVLGIYCETKWHSKWLFTTTWLIILYRQQMWATTRRKQTEIQRLDKHMWTQQQMSWLKVAVYDKLLPSIQLTSLHSRNFVRSLEKEVLVSYTFAESL